MNSVTSAPGTSNCTITKLLRPRSVAVVGASSKPGSLGGTVFANLQRFGFPGDIYLINSKRVDVEGRSCLGSIHELPLGVDCAVLAIPSGSVLQAVKDCAYRKIGSLVIFAAGFAEAGAEGRAIQDQIRSIAHAHNLVIEGPNCLGMINYVDGIPLTFSPGVKPMRDSNVGGLGLVSQSGAMTSVVRTHLLAREVAISYAISTGNEVVTGTEDFLEFLIEQDAVHAVLMIVEQFRSPKRFLQLARRAREVHKPIVLLHPGRSAAARKSAQTHTGALAGDYQLMRALVASEGVAIVDSLQEFIDVAELLIRCPSLPRGGAAVITESGAHKAMVLDACETLGLVLPRLAPATEAALRAVLPPFIPVTNPLDLTAQTLIDPDLFGKTMGPLLADDRYGSLLISAMTTTQKMSETTVPAIIKALKKLQPSKPVVFTPLGHPTAVPLELVTALREIGVPFIGSPEHGLRALARATEFTRPPLSRCGAERAQQVSPPLPSGIIPEYLSKRILSKAGLAIPPGEFVTNVDGAIAAANRIGYPVALKAQSAELSHKSDAGGVVLRLQSEEAVAAGWIQLQANVERARPGLQLDGVLVEATAHPGLELILGARNDRDWGPVLMVGLGGVWAEAMQDFRLLPPDLAPAAIADEILHLKGAALLRAFRGRPALDVQAVAAMLSRLGKFLICSPEINEIDVNPVLVYPEGNGAVAVDALIVAR